ncbi:hypothetical protein, partial [Pantoea allii]|uniref:hypothetical protein n=1 Tax=Pantoea allii TaxID=574096 RepID=UPI003D322D3A
MRHSIRLSHAPFYPGPAVLMTQAAQDSRPDAPLSAGYARKKALNFRSGLLHLFDAWQFPTLAWGDPTLPSALRRFTS